MSRGKLFKVKAEFRKGEIVRQAGCTEPLKIVSVFIATPGYKTSDGRIFNEDELERETGKGGGEG